MVRGEWVKWISAMAAVGVLGVAAGAEAGGAANDDAPFADLRPLSQEALAQARGGIRLGAFDLSVGLTVSNLVEGKPITSQTLALNEGGRFVPVGPDTFSVPAVNPASNAVTNIPLGPQILSNQLDGVSLRRQVEMTFVLENMQDIARRSVPARRLNDISRNSALMTLGRP